MEYANQVGGPYIRRHINSIENVKKRLTRVIPGLKDKTYPERVKELDLMTLAFRRIRGDIIELFKIIKNIGYDKSVTEFKSLVLNTDNRTRGHSLKLVKIRPRLDIRKYRFTFRTVDIWNSLPQKIIDCKTITSFKIQIDKLWQNQEIKWVHSASFDISVYIAE
ncbi:UNVERIFIED_CONTAM: hypothetical protein GTU68_048111 [Idotea baltica]|nr:hypothetical protein [Idotea baltica]